MLEKIPKIRLMDGIFILGLVLIVVGIGMNFKEEFWEKSNVEVMSSLSPTGTVEVESNNKVMIDIEGEVVNPGVYKLEGDVRVNDVLEVAGGLSSKADRDWIKKNLNLANRVIDGEKLYIPKLGEVISEPVFSVLGSSDNKSNKVSLNKASLEELDSLSGIGPALGGRIIDYRERNGGFRDINEIKLVSGIGDKLFEKIKDDISL
jgi:competence protein ComEA